MQKQMFILNQRLKSDVLEERVIVAQTAEEAQAVEWGSELTAVEVGANGKLIEAMFSATI